jgi:hypothetical protein
MGFMILTLMVPKIGFIWNDLHTMPWWSRLSSDLDTIIARPLGFTSWGQCSSACAGNCSNILHDESTERFGSFQGVEINIGWFYTAVLIHYELRKKSNSPEQCQKKRGYS